MTRRRAAWIAAVVAVALAAGYFVLRRARAITPVALAPSAPLPPVAVAGATPGSDQGAAAAPRAALVEPTPTTPPAAAGAEGPLPAWVRVTIVAAALLAFFAVSLIATKRV
jgi:hypothetical protein